MRNRILSDVLQNLSSTIPVLMVLSSLCLGDTTESADSSHLGTWHNWSVMSDLHLNADISRYFLQKNDYFHEHYYVDANIDLEGAVASYNDFFFWIWGFDVHPGMGQSIGNVVFDPIDMSYGVVPAFEFRLRSPNLTLKNGLDHRCFHEVDRRNFNTIYYNKIFWTVESDAYRLGHFLQSLKSANGWSLKNRVQWSARWGFFVREFFGWTEPVMFNDIVDNVENLHEFSLDVRYAVVRIRPVLLVARGTTLVGQTRVRSEGRELDQAYWRQEFSLECMPALSRYGGLIYIKYYLDGLPEIETRNDPSEPDVKPDSPQPRLSKDGLLQVGISFFF